jgi:hypothetical protein
MFIFSCTRCKKKCVCTRAEAKERTRDRVVLKKDKEQGREEQREKANNNKASKQKNEKDTWDTRWKKKQPGCSFLFIYGRVIQDENNTLIYCYQNSDTVITVEENQKKEEHGNRVCNVIYNKKNKTGMYTYTCNKIDDNEEWERERSKEKPVRRISSTRVDIEKKLELWLIKGRINNVKKKRYCVLHAKHLIDSH